jgi:hypothetical protein
MDAKSTTMPSEELEGHGLHGYPEYTWYIFHYLYMTVVVVATLALFSFGRDQVHI